MSNVDDYRLIVHAITDFLQSEQRRTDLSYEQKENLRKCIIFLKIVYGRQAYGSSPRRSLLDMYSQFTNPVTVKDKKSAEALNKSGNGKMLLRKYMEADADYTRAVKLDKWNPVPYCNRAAARIKLGGLRDAIDDCKRAVELNPDYAKAFGRMGQAYVELNDPRSALSCFQKAATLEPENGQYRNNLQVAQQQAIQWNNREMTNFVNDLLPLILEEETPPNSQLNSVMDRIITIVLRREIYETDVSRQDGNIQSNTVSEREIHSSNNESSNLEVERLMDVIFPLVFESDNPATSGGLGSEGHRPRFPYTSTSSENNFENSASGRPDRDANTTREGEMESANCLFKLFSS